MQQRILRTIVCRKAGVSLVPVAHSCWLLAHTCVFLYFLHSFLAFDANCRIHNCRKTVISLVAPPSLVEIPPQHIHNNNLSQYWTQKRAVQNRTSRHISSVTSFCVFVLKAWTGTNGHHHHRKSVCAIRSSCKWSFIFWFWTVTV